MSFPGEIQPLPSKDHVDPNQSRITRESSIKKQSSWHGRKTTPKDVSQSSESLARSIIATSGSPHTQGSITKAISLRNTPIKTNSSEEKTFKQKIEELAVLIENEWNKPQAPRANASANEKYLQFMHNPFLIDALGELLIRNRGTVNSGQGTIKFLSRFADSIDNIDEETITRVIKRLIQDYNPATTAFLFLCKDTSAFRPIVSDMLPLEMALEFIYLHGTNKDAENSIIKILKYRKETIPAFFYITHTNYFKDDMILKIGKEIGEKALFKRFVKAKNSKIKPHLFTQFLKLPTKDNSKTVSKIIEYKLPITREMLQACLITRNFPGIEKLLDSSNKQFIIDSHKEIFDVLMTLRDSLLGELIFKHAPYILDLVSEDTLTTAAEDGNYWFFDWIINCGLNLTNYDSKNLLSIALETGSLPLIKLLCKINMGETKGVKYFYRDILSIAEDEDPARKVYNLFGFALFSPLEEIYTLVAHHPDWADVLNEVTELLPLLVRFPNMQFASEVGNKDKSVNRYIFDTVKYASENKAVTDKLLPLLKHPDYGVLTRDALLKLIVRDRFRRLPLQIGTQNWNLYKEFRKDESNQEIVHKTPLYKLEKRVFTASTSNGPVEAPMVIGAKALRYTWCLKHIREMYYNVNLKQWIPPHNSSVVLKEGVDYHSQYLSYSYEYSKTDGTKVSLPTTLLKTLEMEHTSPETIRKLQLHLKVLHKELVLYDLDIGDSKNLKVFYEKVARSYWLIATLCETSRGTPHNAMIWLNLIYKHHKLPPPIPKIDHFFLDNTMIVTPLEKAIENWESYFEPTLDITLKNTFGKDSRKMLYRLLRVNGNLLRLCSLKVRDNDKLVARAIQSNPDAIQYASKRLRTG